MAKTRKIGYFAVKIAKLYLPPSFALNKLWRHLEARIDQLDAKLGEASNERKYQQIFGRISELIDLKGYINQGWRRTK